jgi:hypothetical protein
MIFEFKNIILLLVNRLFSPSQFFFINSFPREHFFQKALIKKRKIIMGGTCSQVDTVVCDKRVIIVGCSFAGLTLAE